MITFRYLQTKAFCMFEKPRVQADLKGITQFYINSIHMLFKNNYKVLC